MRWVWFALDVLVPLVYFVRRRRPVGGVLVGLWWLYLVSDATGAWLGYSITAWVSGIVAVIFSAALHGSRAKAAAAAAAAARSSVPEHSLQRRLGEALLIGAVLYGSVAIGVIGLRVIEPWRWDPIGVENALWEAAWIAEQSTPPWDLATDPWNRTWVRSAAGGDVWVCSRGTRGDAPCPPPGLGTPLASRAGSVGYSTQFGPWAPSPPPPLSSMLPTLLVLVAAVVPRVVFAAYRVRRRRSGQAPLRLGSGPSAVVAVFVVGLVIPALFPMYAKVPSRARVAKAQADMRTFGQAIDAYRKHTGALPDTLADLTRPATNREGTQSGPFLTALPMPPATGTSHGYIYRRRADGRYRLEWRSTDDQPMLLYGGG